MTAPLSSPRWSTNIDTAARLEDLRFMADTGETLTGAAARLGLSANSLGRWLEKHDINLRRALASREGDWNKVAADRMSISRRGAA